jgi:hypothetical protein
MWFFNRRYYRILSKLDNIEDSIVHNDYKENFKMLSTQVNELTDSVNASVLAQQAAVAAFSSVAQQIADLTAKLELNSDDTAKMMELKTQLDDAKNALVAATPVAPVVPFEPLV